MYRYLLVLAFLAACGKEETPATTIPTAPGAKIQTPELTVPETPAAETPAVPSADAAKAALDKTIADTKDLIAKKQTELKAITEKIKANPMGAAQYQAEADKLSKEIADLQAKLEGYVKEAAAQ